MTLEELLSNKELPDNYPIKIGENEIPLGSLRQASAAQIGALTERARTLDTREAGLTKRQQEIAELAGKAQSAYDAAETARRAAVAAPPANQGADPFADPWLAPVKGELDKRDKTLNELKAEIDKYSKFMQNAAVTWTEDRWDKEYDGLDWGKTDKAKRPSRDDLVKYASENKLVDRRNMPSVRMAWEKMTEPDRNADIAEKARQEGIEIGRREMMASRIPPPGVPGQGSGAPPPKVGGDKGDLGDLYAEALKDGELRSLLEQLPPGMA
jgi:hypothetical protein